MRNLAKHLYRANTHISRVNPRFAWESLRGQAITAPTIDRFSFERSVPSFQHLFVFYPVSRFSYLLCSTNATHERVNLSRLYSDIYFYFLNSSTTLSITGCRLRTSLFSISGTTISSLKHHSEHYFFHKFFFSSNFYIW